MSDEKNRAPSSGRDGWREQYEGVKNKRSDVDFVTQSSSDVVPLACPEDTRDLD